MICEFSSVSLLVSVLRPIDSLYMWKLILDNDSESSGST